MFVFCSFGQEQLPTSRQNRQWGRNQLTNKHMHEHIYPLVNQTINQSVKQATWHRETKPKKKKVCNARLSSADSRNDQGWSATDYPENVKRRHCQSKELRTPPSRKNTITMRLSKQAWAVLTGRTEARQKVKGVELTPTWHVAPLFCPTHYVWDLTWRWMARAVLEHEVLFILSPLLAWVTATPICFTTPYTCTKSV